MSSHLQWYEETPAVCKNPDCDDQGCFELYDVEEVKEDEVGEYVICSECGQKIYLEK